MVSLRNLAALLLRPLRRAALDRSAVAAVEFALILPIMLLLYFGGNEFGNALTISRKVSHLTSTVADLVAQASTVSNSDMTNILNVGSAIMEPYTTSHLRVRVSLIHIDNTGVARVKWSDVSNYGSAGSASEPLFTAIATNTIVTNVPASVKSNNTYLVRSEVRYYFTPTIGYILTGVFNLNDTFYLSPRLKNDVKRPPTYT